jgi:pyruvate dehydrogenase E1 component
MPHGAEEGIRKGLYKFRIGRSGKHSVQLMGSGAILREVIKAAEILERDYSVSATVWSATSFSELQRDGVAAERQNRLNPDEERIVPWVEQCMDGLDGPVIAATDYVRAYAEMIRPYLPQKDYTVLGTDGFGRSDTRKNLRRFFEVDSSNVVYATLYALHKRGDLSVAELLKARKNLGLDADKPNPLHV